MNWPKDAPEWLKTAFDELDEMADHSIMNDEPARACGFKAAVLKFRESIDSAAESDETRRLNELHELTFPKEQ